MEVAGAPVDVEYAHLVGDNSHRSLTENEVGSPYAVDGTGIPKRCSSPDNHNTNSAMRGKWTTFPNDLSAPALVT